MKSVLEIYRIKSCLQDYPYTSKGDWEELAELERLAEIGRATEKAVEKEYYFANPINDGRITKEDIKDLLDWAKED